MTRRSFWLTLALSTAVAVSAEAKPRKFSWEISPFIGARDYDSNLGGLSNSGTYGLRLGYNFTRNWEVELSLTGDDDNRETPSDPAAPARQKIDMENIDVNVVWNFNTGADQHRTHGRWYSGDRWIPYLTAGLGHFSAESQVTPQVLPPLRVEREATMLNVGAGVRLMTADFVGLRFDVRNWVAVDDDEFADNFSNLEASLGVSFIVGGGVPRDSDADSVIDGVDRCPGTPLGCWVDELGCPRDTDGDGVCDGLDRCPNTPAGCPVDQNGCPLDEDGDGVCDGFDDCPGTPPGSWVDERGCSRDSDGDGVADGLDRCPDTDPSCRVDAQGCPLDEDGDGVCDGRDQCPGTPPRTKVDERGCPIEVVKLVLGNVHFEFNKSNIQPFYRSVLDEVARSLLANEWRSVEIELRGHTDNIDSDEYNYRLGQARADAVKDYLVARGVAPSRLVTKSYSELDPIASNDTAEGRALNRRVDMSPIRPVPADRAVRIQVLARDVMFESGSTQLTSGGRRYLESLASAFSEAQLAEVMFKVIGHGSPRNLAEERAISVGRYLVSLGVDRDRIDARGTGGSTAPKAEVTPARAGY